MSDRTETYPTTPDGRYFVVRGRLWRASDPSLSEEVRQRLVTELMALRREIGTTKRVGDRAAGVLARERLDEVKRALGERGPVWWTDGAPDFNKHSARNTPYADWFENL